MNYSLKHTRNQRVGNTGETWVFNQLTERGYDVSAVVDYFAPSADLRIGTLPVEVKYAKRTRRRKVNKKTGSIRWYPCWKWNVTQINAADRVLFLLAEDKQGVIWPFIMPGSVMDTRTVFEINSHPKAYRGFICGFLRRWETVDFLLKQKYYDKRQLDIYHYLTHPECAT